MALASQTTLFSTLCFLFSLVLQQQVVEVSAHIKRTHKQVPSFHFLNHLQGCQKGDKVKGINKLKSYLEQFGYLGHDHSINDDYFDEVTELAIKTYQLHHHLNVTGNLDPETVSLMAMPRCNLPDKIIKSKGEATDYIHQGESHCAFFPGKLKWPPTKTSLTFAFGAGVTNAAMDAICVSLAKWAQVTNFRFSLADEFEKADIKISFRTWDHGDGKPFDGPGKVLAHAFAPTDGRLHYDGSEKWSDGIKAQPDAFDITTIGTHEIGHILGLAHSDVPQAIMFPTFGRGEVKDLHSDDVQGIRALYNL